MLSWSAKTGKREEKAGVVAWRSLRPKLTHHSTRSLGPGGVHLDEDAWRSHAQTTGMGVYGGMDRAGAISFRIRRVAAKCAGKSMGVQAEHHDGVSGHD